MRVTNLFACSRVNDSSDDERLRLFNRLRRCLSLRLRTLRHRLGHVLLDFTLEARYVSIHLRLTHLGYD